jgi:hypothetical protein
MKRRWLPLLALVVVLLVAVWPREALADCDLTNIACHVDSALWPKLLDLARSLWLIDRGLLLMARWIESVRDWLINGVLGTAFGSLAERVQFPFYIAAAIAWIFFIVGYMLQAVVSLNWVDLRKAIRNGALALLVFTAGSLAITWTESLRVVMGQMMQSVAQESFGPNAGPIQFYAASDTVVAPRGYVYGPDSKTCDSNNMDTRRQLPEMHLNDYAANFLLADAPDIHCPPSAPGLPIRSGDTPSFVSEYAPRSPEGDNDADARAKAFQLLTDGIWRLIQGFFLVLAAVIEQVMHTLFAVALAATWFSLAIGLIFSLFVPTEAILKKPIDAIFSILKASWLASFWMGAILALLDAASATGSGLAVVGVGLVGLGAAIWQCKAAFGTISTAASAIGMVAGGAPQAIGGALGGFRGAVVNGALIAGAVATGGVGGLAAMAARQVGRDLAMNTGSGLLGRSAGRMLSNRAATTVSQMAGRVRQRQQLATAAGAALQANQRDAAELAWYESRNYADAGMPDADTRANERIQVLRDQREERMARLPQPVKERIAEIGPQGGTLRRIRTLDRQIAQARSRRNFTHADKLMAERDRLARSLVDDGLAQEDAAQQSPPAQPIAGSRPAPASAGAASPGSGSISSDKRQPTTAQTSRAGQRGAALRQVHRGAQRVARLKRQIAAAQQRGDETAAKRLMAELDQARAALGQDRQQFVLDGRPAGQPAAQSQDASAPAAPADAPPQPAQSAQPAQPSGAPEPARAASGPVPVVLAQALATPGAGQKEKERRRPYARRAAPARGGTNGTHGAGAMRVAPAVSGAPAAPVDAPSPEAIRVAHAPVQPITETSVSPGEAAPTAPAVPAAAPAAPTVRAHRAAVQPVVATVAVSQPVPVGAGIAPQPAQPAPVVIQQVQAPQPAPDAMPVAAPVPGPSASAPALVAVQPAPAPLVPQPTAGRAPTAPSRAPAPAAPAAPAPRAVQAQPQQPLRKWGAAAHRSPRLARQKGPQGSQGKVKVKA